MDWFEYNYCFPGIFTQQHKKKFSQSGAKKHFVDERSQEIREGNCFFIIIIIQLVKQMKSKDRYIKN